MLGIEGGARLIAPRCAHFDMGTPGRDQSGPYGGIFRFSLDVSAFWGHVSFRGFKRLIVPTELEAHGGQHFIRKIILPT